MRKNKRLDSMTVYPNIRKIAPITMLEALNLNISKVVKENNFSHFVSEINIC